MSSHQGFRLGRRSFVKGAAATAAIGAIGFPYVARGESKVVKVGMPTILSGRVAQLGISTRNAVMMEVEKFNAGGGVGGRTIEMVVRDSKGKPDEAARIARELVNSDGCEILFDCEASSGAFAVHEVARDLGLLCIHNLSETSALSADPKIRIPNAFRAARQGIHDSIVGGAYAADIAKANGLKRWMTCSPDYAYGRDTTTEYLEYLKRFARDIEVVGEAWPKLFAPDYTEVVTKIIQARPDALYSCLWGGDLVSFIDQGALYGLFQRASFFAVNMADFTTMNAVKNLPQGIHSGNRYLKSFPPTAANAQWAQAYKTRWDDYPTNWSWEGATGMAFLTEAMKKANSVDGVKIAEVMRGLTISSPFGTDGTITMRGEDQTIVNYAIGWGTTIPTDPFVPNVTAGDWKLIFELEAEWKKSKGYS